MLSQQLFQTLQGLEILRQLDWEVELFSSTEDYLEFWLKTRTEKWWCRIDTYPQKDKPFRYYFSQTSKWIETETEREIMAWFLSDFCTSYVLLLLERVLERMLGYTPFAVPPNTYYDKDNKFYLTADKIAIITTHIIRRPDYNESGMVTVQVPQSLRPEGFYAALAYNKEGGMLIGLNDTYPTVVHTLERMLALSAL
jgi:hypothetical protein